MSELNASFQPQRNEYNKQLTEVDPAESLDLQGLEQAKKDSFEQINTGANRRGMFYSGMPLQEQAKYVGADYLPAMASIKNRYGQFRNNLRLALAELAQRQNTQALGIRQYEMEQDESRRRWEAEQAAAREAAARAAASAGGGGGSYVGGGGGGTTGGQQQYASLRDRWQAEANAGDNDAQVALNYAGNDGRYDGIVNSQWEYDVLKKMGIQGNYRVAAPIRQATKADIPKNISNQYVSRTQFGYVPR